MQYVRKCILFKEKCLAYIVIWEMYMLSLHRHSNAGCYNVLVYEIPFKLCVTQQIAGD